MAYSQLSDKELKTLYAKEQAQKQTPDYSSMSDDELQAQWAKENPDKVIESVNIEDVPLQGNIEEKAYIDSAKSFGSKLTSIPRAISKVTSPVTSPIGNAISYLPIEGIRKLQGKPFESFNVFSKRQNNAYNQSLEDYKPKTWQGNIAGFTGELLPTLAIKAETAFPNTLIGAGQGFYGSVNRGDNPFNVALNTAGAGLAGLTGYGALKGAGATFEKLQPHVAQLMAGIPKESYNRALSSLKNGQNFFEGKFNPAESFNQLGDTAQNAINFVKRKAGQGVDAELNTIRNNNTTLFNTNEISENIANMLASKNYGGIQTLDSSDLSAIENIQNILQNHENVLSPEQLYGLKKLIQNKYQTFDPNKVKLTTGEGDYILNKVSKELNKKLTDNLPDYAKANQEYSNIMNLQKKLGSKLKDQNIGNALRTMESDANTASGYPELFQQLNDIAPENLKFMEQVKDINARQAFERFMPNYGSDMRVPLSQGAFGTVAGYSAMHGNFLPLALGGNASPAIQKLMLQTYINGSKNITPYTTQTLMSGYNQARQ